ncbi:aldo-keto reductase family 1 member C13 [Westerdykella ornata]|uniref:Aldo-keto reductase family 1 member C13 n=1 Tax=Westerdykella ornata TaxID=318751 RepID=A0A6A6JDF7_WESOR|nr:aldo-keto reductase family 1 member C13 [Westerdykella ornata]KAF2274305.1 aldo-keto reductase family 1 member C13 [Westerdykella ornata]
MADIPGPQPTPIPSLKLNDGTSMPMLAYGTGTAWYKTGDEARVDTAVVDAVKTAIRLGFRHLDGAEMYKTETELGIAIQESGVAREELTQALRTSLKKLRVDYVDLYLIHSPFWAQTPTDLQTAWSTMENLKHLGLTKSIGVSNFLPAHLSTILQTARIPPACNQIEFHPYLQHPDLLALHKAHAIATVAYAPLTAATKAKPGPADGILKALAKKYGVSEAEVSLRWCIDQDVVAVTTSGKEQRLSDYLRVARFKLTPREVDEVNEAGRGRHFRGFWTRMFDGNDRT